MKRIALILAVVLAAFSLPAASAQDDSTGTPALKEILLRVDAARAVHNPENFPDWKSNLYSKIEFDLAEPSSNLPGKLLTGLFPLVKEYKDTSDKVGIEIIPVMLSETASERYHSLSPALDKEKIIANRISGVEAENILKQFAGSMHIRSNFYRNQIGALNINIPSPASSSGFSIYNYALLDSLSSDGHKSYRIHFEPKRHLTSPAFEGTMEIDADDYAIREITASLNAVKSVNWIRGMVFDVKNEKKDSLWFPIEENLFVDFAVTIGETKRLASLLGHRTIRYSDPEMDIQIPEDILSISSNTVMADKRELPDDFWDTVRPADMEDGGASIFEMMERIKNTGLYKVVYAIGDTIGEGYYVDRKTGIGIGPYDRLVSFNGMEGTRFQLGMKTFKEFSQKVRLSGYVAYGTEDKTFKGSGMVEYMFRRDLTRKLTLYGRYDLIQLGKGAGVLQESSIFNSILAKSAFNKRSMSREFRIKYEHELNPSFNNTFTLESIRIYGNDIVPLISSDGTLLKSVTANQINYAARFSWDETVSRGIFKKNYLYSPYPVLTAHLIAAVPGITKDSYSFVRTELNMDWNIPIGAFGYGSMSVNMGAIFGDVPYPFLKLHEGNKTIFLDKTSFACMDYYEFASDRWISAFYEHNFGGQILGLIPGVKKLKLREVVNVKAAWGTITDRNSKSAVVRLPEGMDTLEIPYVEVGVGLANIFKLFRVDAIWRVTHPGERNFAVNIGLGMEF